MKLPKSQMVPVRQIFAPFDYVECEIVEAYEPPAWQCTRGLLSQSVRRSGGRTHCHQ